MTNTGNSKVGFLLGVMVLLGLAVYKLFFYTPTDLSLVTTDITTQGSGKQVVDLYQRLQAVQLDTSLFQNSTYRTLVDFSEPIPSQPVGRKNPFDKI